MSSINAEETRLSLLGAVAQIARERDARKQAEQELADMSAAELTLRAERDHALARATEAEGLLRKIVAHVNRAPDRECWAAIIEQVIKVVALLNAMKEEM